MPFRYLRDPLFLACLALYFVNRLVLKPLFPHGFFQSSLNDVICIPFWVPIMLWTMRKTRIRTHDEPPQWHELLIPLVLWSWLFEVYLPRTPAFHRLATSDPYDVLCYTLGMAGASLFWGWWYNGRRRQPTGRPT